MQMALLHYNVSLSVINQSNQKDFDHDGVRIVWAGESNHAQLLAVSMATNSESCFAVNEMNHMITL